MIASFFTVVLPIFALLCGAVEALAWHFLKKRQNPPHLLRRLAHWVFLTYAVSLLFLTIFSWLPFNTASPRWYNLMPFAWLRQEYAMGKAERIKQLLLNIGMFVPEGFLLPVLLPKMRKPARLLLTVLATTAAIETVQYFIGRSADIDDVIMNFIGGAAGFVLYLICTRLFSGMSWWKKLTGTA